MRIIKPKFFQTRFCITALLLSITILPSFAQHQVKGKVVDAETGRPLPFASVAIKNSTIGTISNADGCYSLSIPLKYKNSSMLVRYVGYSTDTVKLTSLKNGYVSKLVASSSSLKELVVMPQDTLILLIKKAARAIPKNYPQKPTCYTGFFRNTIQTPDGKILSVGEAILKGYKNDYRHERHDSQITIEESRKWELNQKDSLLSMAYYGGPHMAYTSDFVLLRAKIVQGDRKFYDYKLVDIVSTPFGDAYKISFDSRNDSLKGSYQGYMLVNRKSLAFQQFEFKSTQRDLKEWDRKDLFKGIHEEAEEKISYEPNDGVWNLKLVNHKFKFSSERLFCSSIANESTFIVNSIDTTNTSPIPFDKQLGYRDIYMQKMTPYDLSPWKDYTIIQQDSMLTHQIMAKPLSQIARKTADDRKKAFKELALKHISRLYYTFDLQETSMSTTPKEYDITFSPIE